MRSGMLVRLVLMVSLVGLTACGTTTWSPGIADDSPIVVYVAREIVTLDSDRPSVGAIAVEGNRIVATGALAEIKREFAGRSIEVDRRFENHTLIPGLINQHEHPWLAAVAMLTEIISIEDWTLEGRTIRRAKSQEEYRGRLQALIDRRAGDPTKSKEVLYTWGFHQLFHGELSRIELDAMSPNVPVVIMQRSLHEIIMNSRAMERFGITQEWHAELPAAARAQTDFERGHFWEQGNVAIASTILGGLLVPDRYLPALERLEAYWHAAGTTVVGEPGGLVAPALLAMQNQILGDADNPFRIYYIADGKTMVSRYPDEAIVPETEKLYATASGSSRFLQKQVKLFADGAMFSQLMKMSAGYLDGHHGEWLMDPDVFQRAFRVYWDAGYQIHVHQNGDAALDLILDTLEANLARHPREDHRTVIVHFGFSRPDQVDRIARLGAVVSANPFYAIALGDRYSEVGIGPERAQEMTRLGDVARKGISFSLHADMPMAPGRPLLLMDSAINRRSLDGNLVGPQQRVTPLQALRAVTLDAAYSLRLDHEVGSLVPGKLANITVLEANPLTVAPETVKDIGVWGTVHEGRVLPLR